MDPEQKNLQPQQSNELPNIDDYDVAGNIVEGSDEHIDAASLKDDFEQPDLFSEQPQQPKEPEHKEPEPVKQEETKPQTPNVEDLQTRQVLTTVLPALRNENQQLKDQIKNLTTQQEQFKTIQDDMHRFGLQPNELQLGLQLAASWKQDMKGTLNKLLTYAQQQGIKVEGQPAPAITRDLISSVLEEKFGPVLQSFQQQQQQEQQRLDQERQAQEQANAFLQQYPDAATHEDAIATLMQKHQLSPTDAYLQLRVYAAENGLDWSKPLAPQVKQKQQPQTTIRSGNNYSPGVRQTALPVQETTFADENMGYDDIIAQVRSELNV